MYSVSGAFRQVSHTCVTKSRSTDSLFADFLALLHIAGDREQALVYFRSGYCFVERRDVVGESLELRSIYS